MLDISQRQYGTAVIHADYEEWKPETMKGFSVSFDRLEPEVPRFQNLDEATMYAGNNAERVFFSSSVDSYTQDVRKASAT